VNGVERVQRSVMKVGSKKALRKIAEDENKAIAFYGLAI
jgi:hypothetical protein